MSASDHLHPAQMKLFMQAHELMSIPALEGAGKPLSEHPRAHKAKLEQSQMSWENYDSVHGLADKPEEGTTSLYDSIKKHGVKTPVELWMLDDNSPMVKNGHHRIASANDINPNMYIPVSYDED